MEVKRIRIRIYLKNRHDAAALDAAIDKAGWATNPDESGRDEVVIDFDPTNATTFPNMLRVFANDLEKVGVTYIALASAPY